MYAAAQTQAQPQAMFNIMPDSTSQQVLWQYACVKAAECYRQNQRVFIFTENQERAHEIDELLWAFDADSFVPHNLVGEGPKQGAAVEIGWQSPRGRRPVLINLTSTMPAFAGQFAQIIDFVPSQEDEKQQARLRYRSYQQQGFVVNHHKVGA